MVPKMPALGLLLECPVFEAYNRKVAATNERIHDSNDPEHRQPIDFGVHREIIGEFKSGQIHAQMRDIEERQAM